MQEAQIIQAFPQTRQEKMGNIRVPGYRLTREITIELLEENGESLASFNDLNLTGRGDCEESARRDLGEMLVELFIDMSKTPNKKLSDHLIAEKEFLIDLVQKRV